MREILAGLLVGSILIIWLEPEKAGKIAHESYNSMIIGWDSVK